MLFQETQHSLPFWKWIWKEKENRILIIVATIVCIIQFSWFKYLYPYPNFIEESSRYIEIAQKNTAIGYFPIGYSKFLRFVSSFNSSHLLLIFVQYFALQAAILYHILSVKYLLNAGKWTTRIIVSFFVLNPLLLHVANMVSADAWFTTLSLVWLTQILWLIYKPTMGLLIGHTGILLLAFMTSHQAIYYPFISFLVIAFVHWRTKIKIIGIGAIILLLLGYIGRTQYEYKKTTGRVLYNPSRGWQSAADALHMYAQGKSSSAQKVPVKFSEIHKLVMSYMDTARQNKDWRNVASSYYLYYYNSPLIRYMNQSRDPKDSLNFNDLKVWALSSRTFRQYGSYLNSTNQSLYFQEQLIPNLLKFYIPDPEAMGKYNMGQDTIESQSASWFKIREKKIQNYYLNNWMYFPRDITPINAVINVLFILGLVSFILMRGYTQITSYCKHVLILISTLWLSNLTFSILESYVTLRHQLFSMIVTLTIGYLLVQYLIHIAYLTDKNNRSAAPTTDKLNEAISHG